MGQVWLTSALWLGLALLASIISIRVAVSVALIEIMVGVARRQPRSACTSPSGSISSRLRRDPSDLSRRHRDRPGVVRRHFWSSMRIGIVGFLAPYVGVFVLRPFCDPLAVAQAQIAGISLSTTSVAVVYAVMVETGFNHTESARSSSPPVS